MLAQELSAFFEKLPAAAAHWWYVAKLCRKDFFTRIKSYFANLYLALDALEREV